MPILCGIYQILALSAEYVKAEDNVNGKSFAEYNKKYEPRIRLRYSLLNIKRNGNLVNFPIFLCDWLNDVLSLACLRNPYWERNKI